MPSARRGRRFRSSARSPNSTARTPAPASRSSPPASVSKPVRRWWMRRARFTAMSPTSRRGCRRWPSRARFWSRRGCSARSPGCSSPRSAARHTLKGVPEPTTLFRLVRASGGGRRSGQRHLTPLVGRDEEMAMLMRRWERARQGDGQLVHDRRRAGPRQIAPDRGISCPAARDAAHLGRMELLAASAEHAAASDRRMGPRSGSAAPTCRRSGGLRTWKARWRRSSSIRRRMLPCSRRSSTFRCRRNARRLWRRRNCGAGNWRR